MRFALAGAFVLSLLALAAPADEPKKSTAKPDKDGWIDLMKPEVWKRTPYQWVRTGVRAGAAEVVVPEVWMPIDSRWIFTDEVKLAPDAKGRADRALKATKKDGGTTWVNGEKGRLPNLITKEEFGDCEIHVEFLVAKGSNAGVKFHEVYEIAIHDSYGKEEVTGSDNGGIYPRADLVNGGYLDKGIPPKVNASKAPGEWQTLTAIWKSPRVDAQGEKTASAVLVKATLNGEVIHENVEVKTPTGGNWMKKETPTGSLMLQCDHGPTAWRNVKIRPAK
jgi:hypothetical protein